MVSATAAPSTDLAQAQTHLETLWGSAESGLLGLAEFRQGAEDRFLWFPTSNLAGAATAAISAAEQGRTVYASMGLRAAQPETGRGDATTITAIASLWSDVDYAGPGHSRGDLPPDREAALALTRNALALPPSVLIDSGGGLYGEWLLREVWAFDNDEERARAQRLSKALYQALRTAAAPYGWHVDNVSDLARVLRVPGTINYKIDGDPRPVQIIDEGGPRYTIDELEEILPDLSNEAKERASTFTESRGALEDEEREAFISAFEEGHRDGARHHSGVHVAGYLLNAGVGEEDAVEIMRRLSVNDRDPADRIKSVHDTYKKAREGKRVSGYYGLKNTVRLGEDALTRLELTRSRFLKRTSPKRPTASKNSTGSNGAHDVPPPPEEPPNDDQPQGGKTERPLIDTTDRDLERTSARAWAAITTANDPPTRFRLADLLVRVVSSDGDAVAEPLTADRLRHDLGRCATWYRSTDEGPKSAAPPLGIVRDMVAYPVAPLPALRGIVRAPIFASDGTLHETPGYSSATRAYYAPEAGFTVPAVPAIPTRDDVAAATRLLIREWLGDFPFVTPAERAHAIALVLLPFVRELIPGPTPLHMIEAPISGSGKGLLANVVLRPATGRPPSMMTAPRDDDEWRKRITAQLMMAPVAIMIDNIVGALDSGDLMAALTADMWMDRVLGMSSMVRLPVRCVWAATANNPVLKTDIARRVVRIRLDPKVDRPWRRPDDDFRHPALCEWTSAHRAELVHAALVLIQHWMAEGRPLGTTRIGSFEDWSAVMGGILGTAEIPGFLENLDELYASADVEGEAWRSLVAAWHAAHGEKEVSASVLFDLGMDVDGLDVGSGSDRSQRVTFGTALANQRDRVFSIPDAGNLQVIATRTTRRAQQYRLRDVSTVHTQQALGDDA